VGLGSSLGDRQGILSLAVQALSALPEVEVLAVSRIWRSVPLGAARQVFFNAAVHLRTGLSARALLAACKGIERRLGRRPGQRWSDRPLDLDILLFGDERIRQPDLIVPHPRLHERPFALLPAVEVAPQARHPILRRPLRELLVQPHGLCPVGVLVAPLLAGPRPDWIPSTPSSARRGRMQFFIDTANIDEIREAFSWGIIDGVTTNPSLIAREGGDFIQRIADICELVQGPVSAETVSQDAEGMIREGRLLAKISPHIVVKVPLTTEGLKATKVLSSEGIDCNVTLCFQPAQALIAAKAGAAYISPFLGRLDDICTDGVALIEQIVQIYANFPELKTKVLSASIRHPLHVNQVALAGSDVATIPFNVLQKLVNHPLTDSGNARFLADWDSVPDNNITAQVERWLAARDS
jgi:transaldolase